MMSEQAQELQDRLNTLIKAQTAAIEAYRSDPSQENYSIVSKLNSQMDDVMFDITNQRISLKDDIHNVYISGKEADVMIAFKKLQEG